MKIVRKKLKDLIPATYNPRKSLKIEVKEEFQKLKKSIKEFGYIEPIIYNKQTGVIVGGHQRLDALIALNYKEVDCVEVDLSIEKEKALNIALNKINGYWDEAKLDNLLKDLASTDIDLSLTGFSDVDLESFIADIKPNQVDTLIDSIEKENIEVQGFSEKEYDPMKKFDDENWMKFIPDYDGYYGIPLVHKDDSLTKEFFEGVQTIDCEDGQYRPPSDPENYCLHFFREDYKFKKYWDKPDSYIDLLRKYKFIIMPDFSTYTDYPYAFQIWNLYRKCWLAAYWQQIYDLKVIPVLSWSDEGSYDFCFSGIEKGSVVAVCSKGTQQDKEIKENFLKGYEKAISVIKPSLVLFFDGIPDDISNREKIIEFSSMSNQYTRINNKKG